MTAPESGHVDPEIQAEWDRAAKDLARRLRPYTQDFIADRLAAEFVKAMSEEGFRPPLPRRLRPGLEPLPANQPQAYAEGLAAARAALGLDHDQEGP